MKIFELAYEQITDAELLKALKEKYSHVSRFCKIAGLDISEFNKMLRIKNPSKRSEYFNNVMSIAVVTDNAPIKGVELTESQLSNIKVVMYKKYKNVDSFCREYGFSKTWMSKLFSGGVIKITPNTEEICKILKVKLN